MDLRSLKQRKLARKTTHATTAIETAQDTPENREYRLLMVRLTDDTQQLKAIESIEAKNLFKVLHIESYYDWIDGVLSLEVPHYDDIVMTMMIWAIDAASVADETKSISLYNRALDIFEWALKNGYPLPEKYSRTLGTFVVEEISNAALKNKEFPYTVLDRLYELTLQNESIHRPIDMIDQVRAKLCKALGLSTLDYLRGNEDWISLYETAIFLLERADNLDAKAGVKTALKNAKKEFESIKKE